MKRYGNLWDKICSMENLQEAHRNARKDKAFYVDVRMVDKDPERYLSKIREMLVHDTYEVSEYSISVLHDKGKERELRKLPYFPDRIIQWAIMLQIEPIFMEVFTCNTCASIKGRGIHRATKLMDKYMKDRKGTQYCFKMDVQKFYPSVNHKILKELLRRKIKDERLLKLLDKIVDSTQGEAGIPIGSYLSQFLANYYLAYFDHFVKEDLGVKYYVRYMDDIVIMASTTAELRWIKEKVQEYLETRLQLTIKYNWQIFPTGVRGGDFVGYRHFYGYKLLRKSTCKKLKKRFVSIRKKIESGLRINFNDWCSANSYKGWLIWCNSYRLSQKYVSVIQKCLDSYYHTVVKNGRKGVKAYG